MITLKNTQRTIVIHKAQLISDAQKLLAILDYTDFDLGIWITTNKTIRTYNRLYRGKDKATDILSFPFHHDLVAGKRIKVHDPDDKNLGDLIISAAYVVQEAEKYGVSFDERLQLLLVHGVCHLLGYDHIFDADFRRMRAKEAYLLRALKKK